jgi:enoyl-CoA hydratase/carnithine racemase
MNTTVQNPSAAQATLIIDVQGHIGRITLNRPDVRNAFNDSVIIELTQAFQALSARSDVRCIVMAAVLRGGGLELDAQDC